MLKTLLLFLTLNGNSPNNSPILNERREDNKNTQIITCIDTTSFSYKLLNAAKKYLGVPYAWGGRTEKGIDCMGLIFLAYSKITGKDWKKLSVYPSKLVKSGKLGKPVKGLDGIIADSADNLADSIKVGDIIYLLIPSKIIKDEPLAIIDGVSYWPWHMGMYAGNGNILHANPCASEGTPFEVIIEPLLQLLERTDTPAIFVTRIEN